MVNYKFRFIIDYRLGEKFYLDLMLRYTIKYACFDHLITKSYKNVFFYISI